MKKIYNITLKAKIKVHQNSKIKGLTEITLYK